MDFKNGDAFRKYNSTLEQPLFSLEELKREGLCPAAGAECATHTIGGTTYDFYTSAQAVPIEGRKLRFRESPLIGRINKTLSSAFASDNPFPDLIKLCKTVRDITGSCHTIVTNYPTANASLHEELHDKLILLRQQTAKHVKEAAALVSEDQRIELPSDENSLLSVKTATKVVDSFVRSLVPDHPKDEFPQTRLMKRHITIHCGDTNTGKTYDALQTLMKSDTGVYLAPLRLLALEVSQTLNRNGIPCNLLTGEEKHIIKGARHTASTVEMLDLDTVYDTALIDEAQMISDPQRGSAWTRALLGVRAKTLLICCSGNAVPLLVKLIEDCGDEYSIVNHTRDTPLVFETGPFVFPDSVQAGDALIVFSRRKVLEIANMLENRGIKTSVLYGALPPDNRRMQTQKFVDGETKAVVATDAIGMGLNLPIKRIVFIEGEKYNGTEMRPLFASEVKQIAGRAGRKNIYSVGYVNAWAGLRRRLEQSLTSELPELKCACYHPIEQYVLNLPLGTLRQRLNACMRARSIEYFRKADLTEPFALLDHVESFKSLSMGEQYRLIFIPFDTKNSVLRANWYMYVRLYIEKKPLPAPTIGGSYLDELEVAYKQLDLYYSFSRAMSLKVDTDWVTEKKREVSEKIDRALLHSKRKKTNSSYGDMHDFDDRFLTSLYRDSMPEYKEEYKEPINLDEKADTDRVAKTTLKSRGWTETMLRDFLPEPILKTNPHYSTAPPMKLWHVGDIKKAEALPEFIARKEKYQKMAARRSAAPVQAAAE
jgi:ATP-dependent RNA helicase SUPV3L1/SUV3